MLLSLPTIRIMGIVVPSRHLLLQLFLRTLPNVLIASLFYFHILPLHPPPFFFSHSSGVKHFGVQACIAAISAFSVLFTNRCRINVVFWANWGETMIASNIWPQPPGE